MNMNDDYHFLMTGHATCVGKHSKKCLSFGVLKKRCRVCSVASRKGVLPKKHSCRKNWGGSAKAMESAIAIKMIETLAEKNLNVKTIIMDDDSTTISRARKEIDPNITKLTDKNHVMKNITSSLYTLKPKHKQMTRPVIDYVKKSISYACAQNHGNPEGIRHNMKAIVPHMYGDHTKCSSTTWCRAQSNSSYKHKSLPYGKDLSDQNLRMDLEKLFEKWTDGDFITKLANLSSSNRNENLNFLISKKAPKNNHFSESESLDFRVAAAVGQNNEGNSYICEVVFC